MTPVFEAVIFDWGGTLTPWHAIDVLDCWLTVTGDTELAERLVRAETVVWTRTRDEHVGASVEDVLRLAECRLTQSQVRAYYDWWDAHTFSDPLALPMLHRLRELRLRIGVLSNTLWPRLEHDRIFSRDGVHHLIDGAVYSSETEWTKPHPSVFRAALDSVGVTDPSRAVFVGDRLFDDIWGAQQVGMATIHIPHSDIPSWQTTGVVGVPDAVVTSLADIAGVVLDWQSGQRPLPSRIVTT